MTMALQAALFVASVAFIVQQWTERADRLVNVVGSTVEAPVLSLLRSLNLLGTGATAFLRELFRHNHHGTTAKKEDDHV
jgi:hypothetical protein